MIRRWLGRFDDPDWLRAFHKWATIGWLVASFPCAWLFRNSVPFVVWLSLYAVVTGHWSAWQSVRAEKAAGDD